MGYTVDADPRIDRQIQVDIDHVSKGIREAIDGVEAIFLVGGFGRGEGGVRLVDGRYKPDNDYDFDVVTTQPTQKCLLKKLEEKLARDLSLRWVHIESRTRDSLSGLPFTQYAFDLKYGSKLIHGDPATLENVPAMEASAMPVGEGERALFTRLWCFLGPDPSTSKEDRFLDSQLSRSLLAICDAKLILSKAYHVSYVERRRRFLERFPEPTRLRSLVDWGLGHKLRPDTAPGPRVLFREIHAIYLDAMLEFARAARCRRFRELWDYADSIRGWVPRSPRAYRYKERLKTLLGCSTATTRYVQILQLKLYAVAAYPDAESGLENTDFGRRARAVATELTGEDADKWNWNELREKTLRLIESG